MDVMEYLSLIHIYPAKRNIEKRIVNKSLNTNPPDTSLIMNSGPTCNKVNTPKMLPTIRCV